MKQSLILTFHAFLLLATGPVLAQVPSVTTENGQPVTGVDWERRESKGRNVFSVIPTKDDNPLNGVTTFDLVLMSKHILGLEPLDSPYKIIAADANKSGSLTTFDIVEFRKLILGINTVLPNNTSWRFLPRELGLNTSNPFAEFTADNSEIITAEVDANGISYSFEGIDPDNSQPVIVACTTADFVGIKVGDVNCTATNCDVACMDCGTFQRPVAAASDYRLGLPGIAAQAGETVVLPVRALGENPLIAFQSGLRFDPSRFAFVALSAGDVPGFTPDCLNLNEVAEGKIKVLWLSFDHESNYLQPGQALFYVALRALSDVRAGEQVLFMDDALFPNIGYTGDKEEFALAASLMTDGGLRGEGAATDVLSVSALPNPSADMVQLSLVTKGPVEARVSVFGAYGARVLYREVSLGKGNNLFAVPEAAEWPVGIYTWQVQVGREKHTGRFVRQ